MRLSLCVRVANCDESKDCFDLQYKFANATRDREREREKALGKRISDVTHFSVHNFVALFCYCSEQDESRLCVVVRAKQSLQTSFFIDRHF